MKALLSFFTVFPVREVSLERAAQQVYLLPLVGVVTGLPGAVLLLAGYSLPPGVVATLALGVVLVGRTAPRRRRARRRRRADGARRPRATARGSGGFPRRHRRYRRALPSLRSLRGGPRRAVRASPSRAALALLAGEISARSAMVITLAFGKPANAGSSSVPFVRALSGPRRTFGIALALLAPLPLVLPMGALAPLAVFAAPLVALASLRVAKRTFGGIGGDVVGATGEACRAVVLISLSAML